MKIQILFFIILINWAGLALAEDYQTGDIIFQSSEALDNKAIELATHSKYSHVGIIFEDENEDTLQVLEAGNPVRLTPLQAFIERGKDAQYEVLRLKNADFLLTKPAKKALLAKGKSWLGKKYDFVFSWTDNELYCSELVFKLFDLVLDIQLAQPKTLKSFDLSNPLVQKQLHLKYGENIPYNENMISPQQIYESTLLTSDF